MNEKNQLLSIGVMTGNSLDGVDLVLTRFSEDGDMVDIKAHSAKSPAALTAKLKHCREIVNECGGDMMAAEKRMAAGSKDLGDFEQIQLHYVKFVGDAIKELLKIARESRLIGEHECVDLIGFHGQTCAHLPPSIAKDDSKKGVYTCQIGDGQYLADMTGITVVYDFRSDDLMNGGEAAPFAPVHHMHLAEKAKRDGCFPIAFCNGGNTSNISVISNENGNSEITVVGWDAGPFNNYPDKLVQDERTMDCDRDGKIGATGKVNEDLLRLLFDTAVVTDQGDNYLLKNPPKSSDPQWYKMPPELLGVKPLKGEILSFEDRVRTAEYFAAYVLVHSLSLLPEKIQLPIHYATCGGGWKNPVTRDHFIGLMNGEFNKNPILSEHQETFNKIRTRLLKTGPKVSVKSSDHYGFDGTAMEARIFADAAVSRVRGVPFTRTSTTGAQCDTICGIIRFPFADQSKATPKLLDWLERHKSLSLTKDNSSKFDKRWSRASAGWQKLLVES